MDNAAKALLIAGEILIAMLILSIGVYIVLSMRRVTDAYEGSMAERDIIRFNTFFIHYDEREDISPQEVASLVNYAQEFNNARGGEDIVVKVEACSSCNSCLATGGNSTIKFTEPPTTNPLNKAAQMRNIHGKVVEFIHKNTYEEPIDPTNMILKKYRCKIGQAPSVGNNTVSIVNQVTFYHVKP